jgi:hypothetical protein
MRMNMMVKALILSSAVASTVAICGPANASARTITFRGNEDTTGTLTSRLQVRFGSALTETALPASKERGRIFKWTALMTTDA